MINQSINQSINKKYHVLQRNKMLKNNDELIAQLEILIITGWKQI